MTPARTGRRIAFVATDGVESVELTDPWEALLDAGEVPSLLSIDPGRIQAFRHLEATDRFEVDKTTHQAHPEDYDGLVLPGGVANPDRLRTDASTLAFVRSMVDAGKPVAVICHGPWTLIDAGVVEGRTITSWPSLQTDLVNAGATWIDEAVVVCTSGPNTLISSRKPDDLDAFCEQLVTTFTMG